jgi:hypothetical protein
MELTGRNLNRMVFFDVSLTGGYLRTGLLVTRKKTRDGRCELSWFIADPELDPVFGVDSLDRHRGGDNRNSHRPCFKNLLPDTSAIAHGDDVNRPLFKEGSDIWNVRMERDAICGSNHFLNLWHGEGAGDDESCFWYLSLNEWPNFTNEIE